MKRIISTILVFALILSLSCTAFAANETEGSTTVTYTVSDAGEVGYIINIPASINLNETNCLEITASRMNTNSYVWVSIDMARTAITGNTLCLDDGYGNSILCDLSVGYANGYEGTKSLSATDYKVASFVPNDTTPDEYGKLYFEVHDASAKPGEFTGIIYFTISR